MSRLQQPNRQPPKSWPRPYLFSIYTQALDEGFVWIMPISREDAASLKMSLYRIRRKRGTSNDLNLPPEYALISVGEWEPFHDADDNGRLPVIYNALPDGAALPPIVSAQTGESLPMSASPPSPAQPTDPFTLPTFTAQPLSQQDIELSPSDINAFVERMSKSAVERGDD